MFKTFVRNESEFNKWVAEMLKDRIDVTIEQTYPPDRYPCLLVHYTYEIDSFRFGWGCACEYLYPDDFPEDFWPLRPKAPDTLEWELPPGMTNTDGVPKGGF